MNPNVEILRRISRTAGMVSVVTVLGSFGLGFVAMLLRSSHGDAAWMIMIVATLLIFVSGYALADSQTFGYLARHDGHMRVHR